MTRKTALIALDGVFQPQDFANRSAVIAAVSGGGDSVALLLLMRTYLDQMDNPPRLIAVTIDHGLRPGSRREARGVADLCASQNIAHEIICWQGEKPQTSLMARARQMRYRLLYERAHFHRAQTIFTGHTLDDVAETYLMRAGRTGNHRPIVPRGLAAMARQSRLMGDICLIRPLLIHRRASLRQFLAKRAIGWIEDPSNEDGRFERARLRQSLGESKLVAAAQAAAQASVQRSRYNDHVIKLLQQVQPYFSGEVCQLDLTSLDKQDVFLPQFLADLACLVGGAEHLRPAREKWCQWLHSANPLTRFTWAGSVIEKNAARIRLWRERRNLKTLSLAAHKSVIWDGRYHITNNSAQDIVIRPASESEVRPFANGLKISAQSLMATPAIISVNGVNLPVLNNRQQCGLTHHDIHITRILRPFYFLQAESERNLIAHWYRIFNLATKNIN